MTGTGEAFPLAFAAGAVLWSGLVWAGAAGAEKMFRLPPDRRAWWLAALALALIPPLAGLGLAVIPWTEWGPVADAARPAASAGDLHLSLRADLGEAGFPLWRWLIGGALLAYGTGVAVALARLGLGVRRVRRIVSAAVPAPRDAARRILGPAVPSVRLLISGEVHTAFAQGGRAPAIVLPRSFADRLSEDQLRLVAAHESAHIRRRDPELHLALGVLEALFWFNPFVCVMSNRVQLAAELACDREALGPDPAARRGAYARTYLEALRLESEVLRNLREVSRGTAGEALPRLPAAYSPHHLRSEKMRLTAILKATRPLAKGKSVPLGLSVAVLGLVLSASVVQGAVLAMADGLLASPVRAEGRLTSPYGMRKDPNDGEQRFHRGVDIAAPLGTPLHAPADGTVKAVGPWGKYGNVVNIDHGNGLRILYAQLQDYSVKWGDKVKAGDVFAHVGMSGSSSTGPHVHIETFRNGTRVDPATVLDLSGLGKPKP